MIMIPTSLKCQKLLRSFYFTSEMPLMREWFMRCRIYMKTRKLFLYLLNEYILKFNAFQRFPKLSDQYFDKDPWPTDNQVRTIMDDDKVL